MDRPSRTDGALRFEALFEDAAVPVPAHDERASARVPPLPFRATLTRKPARFAGLTSSQLALMAVALAAAIWGMWATAKIFALEDRRVVSVRLAAIVNDFVTAEARSGTPPDQLTARTRAFMAALDTVLKQRAADGQVVLVGEAVVAASVPDVTMDVAADLAQLVKMRPPAAMPPAMAPSAISPASPPDLAIPMPAPEPTSNSPFSQETAPPANASLEP
jgi:hypothetical protein